MTDNNIQSKNNTSYYVLVEKYKNFTNWIQKNISTEILVVLFILLSILDAYIWVFIRTTWSIIPILIIVVFVGSIRDMLYKTKYEKFARFWIYLLIFAIIVSTIFLF